MNDGPGLEVRMPRLSESMAEGIIVRWLHAAGSEVERGDELAEIETDKATVSFEADAGGVLEILAEEGATLPVGALIARIGGSGPAAAAPAAAQPAASPAAAPTPPAPAPKAPAPKAGRVAASPLARRRASELGVDLAEVRGTGPGGRIVRADIEQAAGAKAAGTQPGVAQPASTAANGSRPGTTATPGTAADPAGTGDLRGPTTRVPLSAARRLTAERMTLSATTIPSFPLTAEIDMTRALELRERIAELAGQAGSPPAPTLTDIVVGACGRALREHPRVNASWTDGAITQFGRVHVGVAVDTGEALLVPTVTDADSRSLASIATRTAELAQRARAGRITPSELDGATFTVSNLGMFGVTTFEAVINPPQAAILAVGALRYLPRVLEDDRIEARPVLAVTLTSDHRVLDGAAAARFLRRLTELVEHPLALLLESHGGV